LKQKKQVNDVEVFAGDFINRITEEFKSDPFTSRIANGIIEENIMSVIPLVKVNISPRCRPSPPLPYFSFFFPHPCI
jgi:hypothetical protein